MNPLRPGVQVVVPWTLRWWIKGRLRAWRHRGNQVSCPVCGGRFDHFLPYGEANRPNAECPACGCVERHRLLWLWLQQSGLLAKERALQVLYVAPQYGLLRRLRRQARVEAVDARGAPGLRRMDVTNLQYAAATFDLVLCNHVLEHVVDDGQALREVHRVLTPGGTAVLMTPIDAAREQTLEDPTAVTPALRRERFGQSDHVRIYGRDFDRRVRKAGLEVHHRRLAQELPAEDVRRYGLRRDHDIITARKPCRS